MKGQAMSGCRMIGAALGTAAVALLAGCGGGSQTRHLMVDSAEDAVMIQKGTYVYNPNQRHAPVSLSRADLEGIEIR